MKLQPIEDERGLVSAFLEVMREVLTGSPTPGGAELVGVSRAFNDTLGMLERAAPSDVPVLLLGESGTGKELAARALHRASPRRNRAFVPVACSGLTDALFESELFGHERGAFTGAHQRREGLVESARGGTLFLDEIGDVPLAMQVKLLRLLESRQFRRVGGNEAIEADFRLVCATHRPLATMVDAGTFRQDLYYRVNAFPVRMPALRERPEDVGILAEHLLGGRAELSPEALAGLRAHPFPGNVRELKNLLQRAELLTDDGVIRPEHLSPDGLPPVGLPDSAVHGAPGAMPDAIVSLEEAEKQYLRWALTQHHGDRASLADALGVSERTLYRKLSALDD